MCVPWSCALEVINGVYGCGEIGEVRVANWTTSGNYGIFLVDSERGENEGNGGECKETEGNVRDAGECRGMQGNARNAGIQGKARECKGMLVIQGKQGNAN